LDDRLPGQKRGKGHVSTSSKNGRSKLSILDSTSIIDLDKATEGDIEALGVLRAGGARIIVANRDSLGPFGSIDEVKRIPYLTWGEIRKLARRVTFSAVPRPKNAVMPGRADSAVGRQKRRLINGDKT
jgi:DNA uptake protein ComE-like DNA-binding protein